MLGTAARVNAQNSASATVTANVQQPITVTKNNDLSFGQVFPGLNNSVAVTASGAAAFAVQGQNSANVNLTFTLPTSIANGSNTLPLANWVALYNTTNSASSGTSFTPSSSATSATLSSTGFLYVFLGATAQPSVSQVAGTYTGTATMTVVYF
jgi:hypothetical protein